MKITAVNLHALGRCFDGVAVIPNRVGAVHIAHVRRCIAAGLVEVSTDRHSLVLTAKGSAALGHDTARIRTAALAGAVRDMTAAIEMIARARAFLLDAGAETAADSLRDVMSTLQEERGIQEVVIASAKVG